MPDISPDSMLLVFVAAAYTATAAVWDVRWRRIPNMLTVPVFVMGLVYQAFHGWSGLADAGLGFLLGFGTLFILWLIGGGGGGDVKLMGALSVWLGFQLTMLVIIVSTVLVAIFGIASMFWSVTTGNARKQTDSDSQSSNKRRRKKSQDDDDRVEEKKEQRVMAYAMPVAIATWAVLIWKLPDLP